MIRTRFAPSPTGSLHVGNARVAVLNWLWARKHDGAFVLRIEDTDAERNVPGADHAIEEDLAWLGLHWDEGPAGRGDFGPYRQSERGHLYREYADRLVRAGAAYPCFCSEEELERKRAAALAAGEPPHYDRTCHAIPPDQAQARVQRGDSHTIRFRVPDDTEVVVHDALRNEIRVATREIGDFILLRSDGQPTYNFAVVVDDVTMRITHVIRGAGHLSNTPRQVLLFRALETEPPVFVHVPQVLGPDRQKLSKRHGAQALAEYRAGGYHPDGIVNYLSLLAWSSPDGTEVLARERLVAELSLERIGAADVVFDPVKLLWLSAKHIEMMPLEALVAAVRPFVDFERFPVRPEDLPVVVRATRTHLATFAQINEQLPPFLPLSPERRADAAAHAQQTPGAAQVLRAVQRALAELQAWDEPAIDEAVRSAGKSTGTRGRALFEPVRVALTGDPHGPPLAAVMLVRGREEVLAALSAAVSASAAGESDPR